MEKTRLTLSYPMADDARAALADFAAGEANFLELARRGVTGGKEYGSYSFTKVWRARGRVRDIIH